MMVLKVGGSKFKIEPEVEIENEQKITKNTARHPIYGLKICYV